MRAGFVVRFFPTSLVNKLVTRIRKFEQRDKEAVPTAWSRIMEMVKRCYGNGLSKEEIVKIFYHGLKEKDRHELDIASGGLFYYNTPVKAYKMLQDLVIAGREAKYIAQEERDQAAAMSVENEEVTLESDKLSTSKPESDGITAITGILAELVKQNKDRDATVDVWKTAFKDVMKEERLLAEKNKKGIVILPLGEPVSDFSDSDSEEGYDSDSDDGEFKPVISEPTFVSIPTNDVLQEKSEQETGAAPSTTWAPPSGPVGAAHLPPFGLGAAPTPSEFPPVSQQPGQRISEPVSDFEDDEFDDILGLDLEESMEIEAQEKKVLGLEEGHEQIVATSDNPGDISLEELLKEFMEPGDILSKMTTTESSGLQTCIRSKDFIE